MDFGLALRVVEARRAAGGVAQVIDLAAAIDSLSAYRANLLKRGKLLQARAVGHCIALLKRL